uniref:Uncharacterized protein n=1 Tax=Naja naja TaxID=35670 RepID=A0A8C6VL22_NAJNA
RDKVPPRMEKERSNMQEGVRQPSGVWEHYSELRGEGPYPSCWAAWTQPQPCRAPQRRRRKVTLARRRTGLPDPQLQAYLQGRLRLLENDSQRAVELSARLLSIHSEDHLIAITFWTLEETWKFMTYYSLGFLNPCLETLLLDDSFWLSSPEEAAGIEVFLDESALHRIYRGLLIQEGTGGFTCACETVFNTC